MQAWYANNGLLLQLMIFIICFCEDVSDLFRIGDCSNSFINIVFCVKLLVVLYSYLLLTIIQYYVYNCDRQAAPPSISNTKFDQQMPPHCQLQNWFLEVGFIYCFDSNECVHCPAYQTKALYNDDEDLL